jgi:ribosome-binding factor A
MSRRAEQFAATLQTALQEAISRGLQDPRISGLITITSVKLTDDLKTAFISVSILPEDRQQLTMHGLKSAAAHLRHQVGDRIASRQMPELVFKLDESLKKQAGVMEALSRAREERDGRASPPAGPEPGSIGENPDRAYAPGQEHEKDHPR